MGLTYTLPAPAARPNPATTDAGVADLYGYDIGFREDLLLTPGGDYLRLGGVDNARAALYRRLVTRPGEFKFRPSYGVGLQDFVRKPATQANLDAMRQRILGQVSLDTRFSEVDVTVAAEETAGVPVIKVFVRAVVGGGVVRFEPFNFVKDVAA